MKLLHNIINHHDKERAMAAKHELYAEWSRRNQLLCAGTDITIAFHDGVLKAFGYGVGDDGITSASKRQVILEHVLEAPIPPVQNVGYTREWGTPNSTKRKTKLLNALKGLISGRERMKSYYQSSYARAIGQWQEDLNYLSARCA